MIYLSNLGSKIKKYSRTSKDTMNTKQKWTVGEGDHQLILKEINLNIHWKDRC